MTVAHGVLHLAKAETMTMERGRRGSSIMRYAIMTVTHLCRLIVGLFVQAWDDGGYDSHHSYQDYGVGGGGFHGHKKRLVASDPSPHVIFLGLDIGFTESDVRGTVPRCIPED